jgi:hypothetical protein
MFGPFETHEKGTSIFLPGQKKTTGAYQQMSGLIPDERFALTLTLSRCEREEPLEASVIANGHPASAITGND